MRNCHQIEPLLPPYVDGTGDAAARTTVEAHLAACDACRRHAEQEAAGRAVLRARGAALAPPAPPGLATRLTALAREETVRLRFGWRRRLAAAGAIAATFFLSLAIATSQSTVVLAAQLALDHVKCFLIDGQANLPSTTREDAEAFIAAHYGWRVPVPPSLPDEAIRLVSSRRCLVGDGLIAHLLYRHEEEPVSLFIVRGAQTAHDVAVLGHAVEGWTAGGYTYLVVVASGARDRLPRIASSLRDGAQ